MRRQEPAGAEEYLLSIPARTRQKNSLADIRVYLDELGDPEQGLKIIHIAGTNGKGSVCADLTSVLCTAGYRVGTFVSPHLVDLRERFLLNGEKISREELEQVFLKVYAAVLRLTEQGVGHPTFFEFCFLLAMTWFAEREADYCVLETGLGGRLDATSAVRRPLACVITSISLDHMQYLGNTVEAIAQEKAGIVRPAVPLVYDANDAGAAAVLAAQARRLSAPAYPVAEQDLPAYEGFLATAGFAAPYQVMNAALAVKTLEILKIPGTDAETVRRGLHSVRWPGRMEEAAPGIWLDGAHNPGGICAFVKAVRLQLAPGEQMGLLFAAVSDKDYAEMAGTLCRGLPLARVTVARLNTGRVADAGELAGIFRKAGCPDVAQFSDTRSALSAALSRRRPGERLYVAGSLYLIGEVKRLLLEGGTA